MDKKPSELTFTTTIKDKLQEAKNSITTVFTTKSGIPFPDRATTSFGVSMGLGLALESIFPATHERVDKERKIPEKVNVNDYNIIAVNIHSIARDLFHSIPEHVKDPIKVLNDQDFERALMQELHTFDNLFFGFDKKMVYFLPDFQYVASKLNAGKKDTFTKRFNTNLLIYKAVSKMKLESENIKILRGSKFYKINFKPQEKVLMFTSFPYDLLNNGNIHHLEFHTGLLFKKEKFNKKYKPLGKDKVFDRLPFDEILLYLIGDNSSSMLHIQGDRIRKLIYDVMIGEKWTPVTSILRINQSLGKYPIIKTALKEFKRIY